jgi:hypothetical protein
MKILRRLVEALPASSSRVTREIRELRRGIDSQSGDRLSHSHLLLYALYSDEAAQRTALLRPSLRGIARDHLEEAVAHAGIYPEPLRWLIDERFVEEDHWGVISAVSDYLPKQATWMSVKTQGGHGERTKLISALLKGAHARMRLGRFPAARQWLVEAIGAFRTLDEETRLRERDLGGSLLNGQAAALMMGLRYQEALDFIDGALQDPAFERSPALRDLVRAKGLLVDMKKHAQGFESPEKADDLWATLLDDIERCDTPDAARNLRAKVESTIRVHSVNQEVQSLAASILRAMRLMEDALRARMRAPRPQVAEFEALDATGISDPHVRAYIESMNERIEAQARGMQEVKEALQTLVRRLSEHALEQLAQGREQVRANAAGVYRIRLRNRAAWWFWNKVRFTLQLAGVAWLVGTLAMEWFEGRLTWLLKPFGTGNHTIIVAIIVLVVGFFVGAAASGKVDARLLPRYKDVLRRIVSDHTVRLWSTYNTLLTIMKAVEEQHREKARSNLLLPGVDAVSAESGVSASKTRVDQQSAPQPVDLHAP